MLIIFAFGCFRYTTPRVLASFVLGYNSLSLAKEEKLSYRTVSHASLLLVD